MQNYTETCILSANNFWNIVVDITKTSIDYAPVAYLWPAMFIAWANLETLE